MAELTAAIYVISPLREAARMALARQRVSLTKSLVALDFDRAISQQA